MSEADQQVYEFGPFRLDPRERRLTAHGRNITLTEKVFELLVLLVTEAGHVLSKAELLSRLWPDAVVEENNLTVNISILRKALGETAFERRYIETVSRRGYRFVGAVRPAGGPASAPQPGSAPAPNDGGAAPFVGRERELAQLQELLERALTGQGQMVLVSGAAGMGKTELCERFLLAAHDRERSLLFASGRCLEQYGTREAYLPFLDAMRGLLLGSARGQVAELLRRHSPSWCNHFPTLLHPPGDAEVSEGHPQANHSLPMLRELADAFEALSSIEPVVLFLEDLHWADPSSSDLLGWLARRLRRSRILILATVRADQVEVEEHPLKNIKRELLAHGLCSELALELLGAQHIAHYLDARFAPHEFPPELEQWVTSTSGGQPFFATRLADMLVDRGDVRKVANTWLLCRPVSELKLGVPDTVRGVIQRKLDLLDEPDYRALQYASVIGGELSSATLASVLGVEEVLIEERLHYLARAHRLVELLHEERLATGQLTLRYRFAHVLYRNVLYESLASKRRMLLHRQVAEALLTQTGAAAPVLATQLALHFEAAREFERAIHYAMQAADNASRLHANREAQQHYDHALAMLPELAPSARVGHSILLHYNRGWASYKMGNAEAALGEFEAMLQRASDEDFSGTSESAQHARDLVFDYLSEPWRDAFGMQAMPRMPNQQRSMGAAAVQCEAYSGLCYALLRDNRAAALDVRLQELLQLAEASGNEPRAAEALAWMALRQLRQSNLAGAAQLAERSIRSARALDHSRALSMALYARARVNYLLGDYRAAELDWTESLKLTFEAESRIGALLGLGLCRAHLGRISAALATFAEASGIAQQAERRASLQELARETGNLYLEIGAWQLATPHLQRALELARANGQLLAEADCQVALARAYDGLGDKHSADGAFEAGESLSARAEQAPGSEHWYQLRIALYLEAGKAEHRLARGELDNAARCARAMLEAATLQPSLANQALARQLLARSELARGNLAAAHSELAAGLGLLTQSRSPLVCWKLFATLGAERLRAGEPGVAGEAFGRARAFIDELAHGIDDTTLRAQWLTSPAVELVPLEARGYPL